MLYIPKIDDYVKILTDDEVRDSVTINFSEYFKSAEESLFSKLNEEKNLSNNNHEVEKNVDHAIKFFR